jgi:hypothetical protein
MVAVAVAAAIMAEAEPAFRSNMVTWACRRRADPFPYGGAGASACSPLGFCSPGPAGGFGGGGGGGYNGGGGGGGDPGGAGGYGGSGGYSYVTALNPFGITGGNGGDFGAANGYVSIDFVAAPEPSTWAMTIMGFAGLGWLAHMRRRKLTPA